MSDNSDYTKVRDKLHEMLPSTYQSDTARAFFENSINRFLTKTETESVAGYIGEGSPNAVFNRQIQEPTVDRQAYQLQPIMYNKIGSIEHMASWKDVLNELERVGVDVERLPEWGNALVFNWVPPIDIDKIINYRDYYWYDPADPNSARQYITIRSRCTTATSILNFWQSLIDEFGSLIPIDSIDGTGPTYDTIVLVGDYTRLLETGFEFYIKNSTNGDLNNTYATVAESTYDPVADRTYVTIDTSFTDSTGDGDISLEEQLAAYQADVDCLCDGTPPGCDVTYYVDAAAQWIEQNKWVHKNDVPNFSTAKQAEIPIIEYDWDLELNEWTVTNHRWKYRADTASTFVATDAKPLVAELTPLDVESVVLGVTTFSEKYGDMTDFFTPGTIVQVYGGIATYEVVSSSYFANPGETYKTLVTFTDTTGIVAGVTQFQPTQTSQGDTWSNFHNHWLYDGVDTTTPINHQTVNPYVDLTGSETPVVDLNYSYRATPYAQHYTVTALTATEFALSSTSPFTGARSLRTRALIGTDDIRVYVNNVRQYGTYNELLETELSIPGVDTTYVAGISFLSGFEPEFNDSVRIEVGEASLDEFGLCGLPVRTIEDNTAWDTYVAGLGGIANLPLTSLISLRKVEQIKSATNQYPLFDIYTADGTTAYDANPIFGFQTSEDESLNAAVGLRLVVDDTGLNYGFEQYIVDDTTGEMFAYRDYSKDESDLWLNPETGTLLFWNGLGWTTKEDIGGELALPTVIISPTDPLLTNTTQDDPAEYTYWFNPDVPDVLRQLIGGMWSTLLNASTLTYDQGLQVIWKKGLNDEHYIPTKRDWKKRSEAEYNEERDLFIETRTDELMFLDPTLSLIDAQNQASTEWYASQVNDLSPTGEWIGDWEIPQQLYHNYAHENRRIVLSSELLTHFRTIIEEQPKIPGYQGLPAAMFRLLPLEEINYGLGGKIKEFNDGFTTLLSSTFVNNVTPPTLYEFGHDQYESLLNSLKEGLRRNAVDLLLNTSQEAVLDLTSYASDFVLTEHQTNDANSLVYGDSTTYTEVVGGDDLGLRNWIATLPYLSLARCHNPAVLTDPVLDINEVIHHDGHRNHYELTDATVESLIQTVINTDDDRTRTPTPNDPPQDTYGRMSNSVPPNDTTEFATEFNTDIENREGVYWYYISGTSRTLYRLVVANIGTSEPSVTLPDGTLWIDTTPGAGNENLRQKNGATWTIIIGGGALHNGTTVLDATISAWQIIDLNAITAETIFSAEEKLLENAPCGLPPAFDFATLTDTPANQALYDEYLEQAFLTYVRQAEITAPYSNDGYIASNPFTWNYKYSVPTNPFPAQSSAIDPNTGTESGGDWRDLYEKVYNTPYPHLEPWKLQGYTSKPDWWDEEYLDTTGTRRWDYTHGTTTGMWENIRVGRVPSSGNVPEDRLLPDGVTPTAGVPSEVRTYDYFSVNIGDTPIILGTQSFNPDDVLPPYAPGLTNPIRSIYTDVSEIVAPGSEYLFGDAGPVEWEWRASSQFLYDQMTIAFRMQPMRFVNKTFGIDFDIIAGLEINDETNKVLCHCDTEWHGEVEGNQIRQYNGTNQWYVNFNRYSSYDASLSDFRIMWTGWTAPMTYQFSSFIDTPSLQVGHRLVCISDFDYEVTAKRSPGAEDAWLDAFDVTVLSIPPKRVRYDNQMEWDLEVDTNSPLNRPISYYDVRNYQFYTDPVTDVCTLYKFDIIGASSFDGTFTVRGDYTQTFAAGRTFVVADSVGNDGTYTVTTSEYDRLSDNTIILTLDPVTDSEIAGTITADYRTLPWETGDSIWFTTEEQLPQPLLGDTVVGTTRYFIIRLSDTEFQVARTRQNAIDGLPIDMTTSGRRNSYVGELHTTFTALDGLRTSVNWRHYTIDRTNVLTFTPPMDIRGMQTLVNIVRGYEEYVSDQGWAFNVSKKLFDYDNPSRFVDWQLELERYIDWAYGLHSLRARVDNRFEVEVDVGTNEFVFVSEQPQFITGDAINLLSSNSVFPTPLIRNIKYYVIRDQADRMKLAATRLDATLGNEIDITADAGVGTLHAVIASSDLVSRPRQAINPFREAIWFRPERGIVSDVVNGPSEDLRLTQLIYDQYGRSLKANDLRIFREDKETQISMAMARNNDIELTSVFNDPYNYIHIGGAHIFVDTYEHVLIFNNYTSEDQLLYDPFVGLNVTKFELLFNRQTEFTQRPNVGGHYLSQFFNQGAELERNMEANVEDVRYMYDTYTNDETALMTQYARQALGYKGTRAYLDNMNLNAKSQFVFWRGMIQQKGSINAVQAFVNSRRFIDAQLDEFWAYKIGEFGSAYEKEYPSMFLTTEDARSNALRLQFVKTDGSSILEDGFTEISLADQDRWYNQPDQVATLRDNGSTLYFDLKATAFAPYGALDPSDKVGFYARHNFASDYVAVTCRVQPQGTTDTIVAVGGETSVPTADYIPNTDSIRVFKNGSEIDLDFDYTYGTAAPLFANTIGLVNPLVAGDTIQVVHVTSTLVEGTHYSSLNSNIVEFVDFTPTDDIRNVPELVLWGLRTDRDSQNPAKLIDVQSEVVVSPITFWDPARGIQYYNAIHIVDLERDTDPAIYSNTLERDQSPSASTLVYPDPWNATEVNTTWLDTFNLDYIPYYDQAVLPALDDRQRLWGQLAEWADTATIGDTVVRTPKIYEWVESDIPPSEWNGVAANEEGDNDILEANRKSGRTFQTFFEPVNQNVITGIDTTTNQITVAANVTAEYVVGGKLTIFGSTNNDADYTIAAVSGVGPTIITVNESLSDPTVDGEIRQFVRLRNKHDEFDFVMDAPYNLVNLTAGDVVDVFVNGRLVLSDYTVTDPFNPAAAGLSLTNVDRVRLVKFVPTDEVEINDAIEAGTLRREYQYTEVPYYDEFGIERSRYYFWVEQKGTRHAGQAMSPLSAQQQLSEIPVPYMFFQNPMAPETITTGVSRIFDRTWSHFVTADDVTRFTGLGRQIYGIARTVGITNIRIVGERSGDTFDTNLAPTEYGLLAGNKEVEIFSFAVLLNGVTPAVISALEEDDEITIDYQIEYYEDTSDVPARHTQTIIRGLRGLINDERRYTIRFTRDFTLRDSLEKGNSSLELKNRHEEWEMFRREQTYNIDRALWDKITESIVGYKLSDPSVRVPSIERELYDTTYDTDTRFGIRDGQAFTDGPTALATILAYLEDANNDFFPIDINTFFENNDFTTNEGIVAAMDTIYNTFRFQNVNGMFFEVLYDAFTFKSKYEDIFKTSMVALFGVQPFELGGVFDD